MSYTSVRSYTDKEILDLAKKAENFKGIPKGYWICGIRSKADKPNVFDDKFYLFKGEQFIMVTTGTTNPGKDCLVRGWLKVNKEGAFILKSNYWHNDMWKYGMHNGKIKALIQTGNVATGYRDNNNNEKAEEIGEVKKGWYGINFHANSYKYFKGIIAWFIGEWSYGCQVANNLGDYYKILEIVKDQKTVSYCLLKEF